MNQNKIYGNIIESAKTLADFQKKHMTLADFSDIRKSCKAIPEKIYCNKKIVNDLRGVFLELIKTRSLISSVKLLKK